jgi:hypothetical protein
MRGVTYVISLDPPRSNLPEQQHKGDGDYPFRHSSILNESHYTLLPHRQLQVVAVLERTSEGIGKLIEERAVNQMPPRGSVKASALSIISSFHLVCSMH